MAKQSPLGTVPGKIYKMLSLEYLSGIQTPRNSKVTIAEHPCPVFMYSPDSSTIITCGMHGEERSRRLLTTGDGREYTLGDGRVIRLWDVNTGKYKATLEEHAYDVQSFAVRPDGSTIITGGLQDIKNDGHFGWFIRLWDATTGKYKTILVDDRNRGGGPR